MKMTKELNRALILMLVLFTALFFFQTYMIEQLQHQVEERDKAIDYWRHKADSVSECLALSVPDADASEAMTKNIEKRKKRFCKNFSRKFA